MLELGKLWKAVGDQKVPVYLAVSAARFFHVLDICGIADVLCLSAQSQELTKLWKAWHIDYIRQDQE